MTMSTMRWWCDDHHHHHGELRRLPRSCSDSTHRFVYRFLLSELIVDWHGDEEDSVERRTTTATNDDAKRKFKSEVDPEIERLVKEFHVQDGGGNASTNKDDGDSWVVEKKRHGHTTAQTVVAEKAVVEVDNPFDVLGVEDDEEEETTTLAKDLNYSMRSTDLKDNMNKKKKKKKFWLF